MCKISKHLSSFSVKLKNTTKFFVNKDYFEENKFEPWEQIHSRFGRFM